MLVLQVQGIDKRFQPWGTSAVDEMISLQGEVMLAPAQKKRGLQEPELEWEQLLGLLAVESDTSCGA